MESSNNNNEGGNPFDNNHTSIYTALLFPLEQALHAEAEEDNIWDNDDVLGAWAALYTAFQRIGALKGENAECAEELAAKMLKALDDMHPKCPEARQVIPVFPFVAIFKPTNSAFNVMSGCILNITNTKNDSTTPGFAIVQHKFVTLSIISRQRPYTTIAENRVLW